MTTQPAPLPSPLTPPPAPTLPPPSHPEPPHADPTARPAPRPRHGRPVTRHRARPHHPRLPLSRPPRRAGYRRRATSATTPAAQPPAPASRLPGRFPPDHNHRPLEVLNRKSATSSVKCGKPARLRPPSRLGTSDGRDAQPSWRETYARFKVAECWRFDRTGGRFYNAALSGDRLTADGTYRTHPGAPTARRHHPRPQRGIATGTALGQRLAVVLGPDHRGIPPRTCPSPPPNRPRQPPPRSRRRACRPPKAASNPKKPSRLRPAPASRPKRRQRRPPARPKPHP